MTRKSTANNKFVHTLEQNYFQYFYMSKNPTSDLRLIFILGGDRCNIQHTRMDGRVSLKIYKINPFYKIVIKIINYFLYKIF